MPGEASPLLAGSPPAIELRRARVVACMLVIAFSASIAKTFVDRALDATEYAIAELRDAPLIVSTLPGASTGVYALGKAFSNEEFVEDDRRVRASHILIKGEGDLEKVVELMQELGQRVQQEPDRLAPIFAELARRESQCSSASSGGDLGLFGPGKMVQELDTALFPAEDAPQPGAILGPVVTDFGCHLILVTKREPNRDQVEEKLARND